MALRGLAPPIGVIQLGESCSQSVAGRLPQGRPASAEVEVYACAEAVPLMSSGSMMLRQRSTMMPPARRPNLYLDEVRQ